MRRVAWMRIIKYLFTKKLFKLFITSFLRFPRSYSVYFHVYKAVTEPAVYHCIDFFFGVIDLRRFRAYCGVFLLLLMWLLKLG